ncbi:hypothetical protein HOY80DRAFT_862744, partial [Tuber brumale]
PLQHQLYWYCRLPPSYHQDPQKKKKVIRPTTIGTKIHLHSSLIPALDQVKPVPDCRTPHTVITMGKQFVVIML